ncbi:hypothetical protein FBALC1_11322 [Flavobacteriales bacterium ALC-1]|nr:hypothetical protein FBALC1_11322 [Flavobacteriales bacterium ALC-1]
MGINAKSIIIQFLTYTIGNTLVFLQPKRAAKLSKMGLTLVMNNNLSITDRLIRNAILKKVENKSDYNTLAKLHYNYWVNQGADFFATTNNSFENNFLPDCSFIFGLLKEELINEPEEFKTLVEIGTGNGNVLEYLSLEFPKINRFVGIDLSPIQIKMNNEKFEENKKIEFVTSDGFEWVKEYGHSNTIFVTSRGVLEYFTQERLQAFLTEINNLGKVIFIAIEPNDIGHDFKTNPDSQPYGHERSFSHNYPQLFKTAGFSLWHVSHKDFGSNMSIQSFIGAKS